MPRGVKPKDPGKAVTRHAPTHPWNEAAAEGWQHGDTPECPHGLTDVGKTAWSVWLTAWWAFFYTPDDLPGLELTVKQYDRVMQGNLDVAKVVPLLDRYGITPKGRQDLRWARPKQEAPAAAAAGAAPQRLHVVDAS